MLRYVIRRLFWVFVTLFIIVSLSFVIIHQAPGGPFSSEKKVTAERLASLEKKYHLNEPFMVQYFIYLGGLLQGDLGLSYNHPDKTANELLAPTLPVSMFLGLLAMIVALLLGITSGTLAALKQNKLTDYSLMTMAVISISVPMFVVGPVFMWLFAIKLHWFPTSGWPKGFDQISTLVLPVLTLALSYFGTIARLTRASVLETLRADHIRTARSKGLTESMVVRRHVLKGAMLPIVSFLGPAFADIITGSVVVESVFLVPGVGRMFVQSALNRDYTLILASVIVYSVILILLNFIVDIIYGLLDPRISYK